jgi:hypothetical protein
MRVHIVTEESGRIVAAAHAGDVREPDQPQAGFFALAGQTIVELDLPVELSKMEPRDRLSALFKYRVADGKRLEPVTRK